jgi:hypothetical protein
MIKLNGSIGYTLLSNNKHKVLVLADVHSKLPYCKENSKYISEWFKTKFNKTNLLLEEVPRRDTHKLEELWLSSPHTQKLKDLYIDNPEIINAIDIRPFLIPFSWELVFDKSVKDIKLKHYLIFIDSFFKLEHPYLKQTLGEIYTEDYLRKSDLGNHFVDIKKILMKLIENNNTYLNKMIRQIVEEDKNFLEKINYLISRCMEWYCIALIYKNKQNNQNFIIHAGLFHTDNIVEDLVKYHHYTIIEQDGVNSMDEKYNNHSGCLHLPVEIEKHIGGSIKTFGFY